MADRFAVVVLHFKSKSKNNRLWFLLCSGDVCYQITAGKANGSILRLPVMCTTAQATVEKHNKMYEIPVRI